jgi:hypothetical protein
MLALSVARSAPRFVSRLLLFAPTPTIPMFLSAKVLQSLTTVFEQSSATETNHAEGVNPRESNVSTKSQFDSPRRTYGARLSSFGSSRNRTIPS